MNPRDSRERDGARSGDGLDVTSIEQRAHGITVAERQNHGISEVVKDPGLADVARAHSQDMRNREYHDHISPEGDGPKERIEASGYDLKGVVLSAETCSACGADLRIYDSPEYCLDCGADVSSLGVGIASTGENVACIPAGEVTNGRLVHLNEVEVARKLITEWLNSPDHRENLLDYQWERHGIGIAINDSTPPYVFATQLFS